uniref:Uncharacterized protein n=1 Tax=Anopheles farauti TaxID=69004 RepID=A0A182QPE4_9DIPT
MHEQAPDLWIGFNPSVIYQETATELSDPATIRKTLMDTIEICMKLGTSETFQKLGLSLQPHRKPPPDAYSCPADQTDSALCFVNYTLSTVYDGSECTPLGSSLLPMVHLAKDFRLKASRNLRLLPFGLTSPFLEHWWKRVFSARKTPREYTTRTGILRPELSHRSQLSMDTLLDKLRERLKVIGSLPMRR